MLGVYFGFTRGLLFGSTLRTEAWSIRVFYLTILLPVIPTPCIVQIHKKCLVTVVNFWFNLGLLRVNPWVNPEQTPKENPRLSRGLISFRLCLIGILYMLSSNIVCLLCLMLIIAIQGIKLTYYIYNYIICLIHVWSLDRIFDARNTYTNHSNRTHWTIFFIYQQKLVSTK